MAATDLSFGNRITEICAACDQTSEYPEREISLEARFYRTDKDRIAGWCGFDDGQRARAEQAPIHGCPACILRRSKEADNAAMIESWLVHDEPSA